MPEKRMNNLSLPYSNSSMADCVKLLKIMRGEFVSGTNNSFTLQRMQWIIERLSALDTSAPIGRNLEVINND